jgi:glycosyltransferase involved in cell wall biosynthesis
VNLSQVKIAVLAGTLGQGGAERQLFYLLRALCGSGVTPRLLCFNPHGFWEDQIRGLGVSIINVGHSRFRFSRVARMVRELRQDPPHVLQSQHFHTSSYAGLAARLVGCSSVGALRSNGEMEVRDCGAIGAWMSLRFPQMIAANSRVAIRYAEGRGIASKRLFLLPNVVDVERWIPVTKVPRDSIRLVAVGSLLQVKRFDRFLSVLKTLRERTSLRITGVIAGAGPLRSQLEAQAQAMGLLPGGVEFLGAVANLVPVYQGADICVLTSDYEGTPNVLLEAMASGLPAVATRVGGVPDLIRQGENGFLVDPEAPTELFEAIWKLTVDSELRHQMGRRARQYVMDTHSEDKLPGFLGQLYQQVNPSLR